VKEVPPYLIVIKSMLGKRRASILKSTSIKTDTIDFQELKAFQLLIVNAIMCDIKKDESIVKRKNPPSGREHCCQKQYHRQGRELTNLRPHVAIISSSYLNMRIILEKHLHIDSINNTNTQRRGIQIHSRK
jgi:hypothetical protein